MILDFLRRKQHPRVEIRLRDLEDGMERLKRLHKELEAEWSDTLDRVNRLMGRIAKRAQVDARASEEAAGGGDVETARPDPLAHLDPISRKIYERRGRRGLLPPTG